MEQVMALLFWLGQSCFVIDVADTRILVDPYNPKMGYEVKTVEGVDVVTVSHEHGDHNYVEMAAGKPLVLRGLTKDGFNAINQKIDGVSIRSVNSYHDASQGKERGRNAIFIYEIAGSQPPLRLVHMGDFGEKRLTAEQLKAIGAVDVLLLPVGGYFTIGPAEADQIIADLKPKIVVPMHWKTAKTAKLPIQDASAFLKGRKNVMKVAGQRNQLSLTPSLLKKAEQSGEPLIVPLEYGPAPAAPK
jgi:L-ascorbate metabolism protein UlaG (beta-lactamase superfamily)